MRLLILLLDTSRLFGSCQNPDNILKFQLFHVRKCCSQQNLENYYFQMLLLPGLEFEQVVLYIRDSVRGYT